MTRSRLDKPRIYLGADLEVSPTAPPPSLACEYRPCTLGHGPTILVRSPLLATH